MNHFLAESISTVAAIHTLSATPKSCQLHLPLPPGWVFWSFPRELRNIIYSYILLSHTGYIQPVSRNAAYHYGFPQSISPSGPRFYLTIQHARDSCQSDLQSGHETPYFSLSLLRTCRAVHRETKPMFWQNNIFYFVSSTIADSLIQRFWYWPGGAALHHFNPAVSRSN